MTRLFSLFITIVAVSLLGVELWYVALPGKFGEKRVEVQIPAWQMHLQQMVVADDPVTYLGDHLNG